MSKLTYSYVKQQIKNVDGYKLLSKIYINNRSKIKIQCSKGHIYETTWMSFQIGNKCPYCAGNKKLTYEYVKEQIENVEKYKLLSTNYVNNRTKLEVQCDKCHEYEVRWIDFKNGHRCPICAGKKKHTYEFIKSQIKKEGYKLLSEKYVNSQTKLKIQCNEGHKYEVTWSKFQRGRRCPYCAGNAKLTYNFIKSQIKKEGYNLLSKSYVNNSTKLKVQCDKGHIYKVSYNNFKNGRRCPICDAGKQSSKDEREILNIIKQLLPCENIISNNRTQIINPLTGFNLELDIWIPELKKAIEFNGRYWHSLEEVKIRDVERSKQCKKKGIKLLVINEQKWLDDKSKVINQIKVFLNEGV